MEEMFNSVIDKLNLINNIFDTQNNRIVYENKYKGTGYCHIQNAQCSDGNKNLKYILIRFEDLLFFNSIIRFETSDDIKIENYKELYTIAKWLTDKTRIDKIDFSYDKDDKLAIFHMRNTYTVIEVIFEMGMELNT
jgi:hypothetical protein